MIDAHPLEHRCVTDRVPQDDALVSRDHAFEPPVVDRQGTERHVPGIVEVAGARSVENHCHARPGRVDPRRIARDSGPGPVRAVVDDAAKLHEVAVPTSGPSKFGGIEERRGRAVLVQGDRDALGGDVLRINLDRRGKEWTVVHVLPWLAGSLLKTRKGTHRTFRGREAERPMHTVDQQLSKRRFAEVSGMTHRGRESPPATGAGSNPRDRIHRFISEGAFIGTDRTTEGQNRGVGGRKIVADVIGPRPHRKLRLDAGDHWMIAHRFGDHHVGSSIMTVVIFPRCSKHVGAECVPLRGARMVLGKVEGMGGGSEADDRPTPLDVRCNHRQLFRR